MKVVMERLESVTYVRVLITHSATSKSPALNIFTEVKICGKNVLVSIGSRST